MAGETELDKLHREYVESGRWKCDKSPTGAHHWIEPYGYDELRGIFYCKYCFDVRRFPVTFEQAIRVTRGGKLSPIIPPKATWIPENVLGKHKRRVKVRLPG